MLGRVPFAPFRSAYSGAKHVLNALTANLREELRERIRASRSRSCRRASSRPSSASTRCTAGPIRAACRSRRTSTKWRDVIARVIETRQPDVYTRPGCGRWWWTTSVGRGRIPNRGRFYRRKKDVNADCRGSEDKTDGSLRVGSKIPPPRPSKTLKVCGGEDLSTRTERSVRFRFQSASSAFALFRRRLIG